MSAKLLSVGDISRLLGAEPHQVRRSVDRLGVDVPRVGRYRMVPRQLLPSIAADLRERGHISGTAPAPIRSGNTAG